MLNIDTALDAKAHLTPEASSSTRSNAVRAGWRFASMALPYAMIAPAMTVFSVFVLYPIGYMMYLSFFKWNMIGTQTFVGFDNFASLFADAQFWRVMGNSFQYMFLMVAFSVGMALPLAVYLKKTPGSTTFCKASFSPPISSRWFPWLLYGCG
jgi:sn-glycerol 3-phosphate transport system permease protein